MAEVCVFLADGFEEIEGLTVVDLLRRAGVSTAMVGIQGKREVTGSHNIRVQADVLLEELDTADTALLVLPGGMPGTTSLGSCRQLTELLQQWNSQGKRIGAICAAPSVLGTLGILEGKKAVCYPGFEDKLTGAKVLTERVITDGNVTTSRGMGTAIPFGLELISLLKGPQEAEKIRNSILYGHKTAGKC